MRLRDGYRTSVSLWMNGFGDGSANKGEKVKIDLHKQDQTNGCIFIVDDKAPAVGTQDMRTFEPALITKNSRSRGRRRSQTREGSRQRWNDARSHYHAVIRIARPRTSIRVWISLRLLPLTDLSRKSFQRLNVGSNLGYLRRENIPASVRYRTA